MTDNVENRLPEMLRRLDIKMEGIAEDVREIRTTQLVYFTNVGRVRLYFNDKGEQRAHSVRLYALGKGGA